MRNALFDEMLARFSDVLARSPAKDVEHNAKALIKNVLLRMDLVDRAQFDAQKIQLAEVMERLSALEARVAELEGGRPAPTPQSLNASS